MSFNEANTVEQMILVACQGLCWRFAPGPQLPLQAAEVFVHASREATIGNSLGRKSEVPMSVRRRSRNATTGVPTRNGLSIEASIGRSPNNTPAVASRLLDGGSVETPDWHPGLAPAIASRLLDDGSVETPDWHPGLAPAIASRFFGQRFPMIRFALIRVIRGQVSSGDFTTVNLAIMHRFSDVNLPILETIEFRLSRLRGQS